MARHPRKQSSLARRARRIRLLLMDVDGVLTDGRIWLLSMPDGTATEMKAFHAHDGAGLKLAQLGGLRTGLITGRDSAATARRAQELGMEFVYQNCAEKIRAYEEILKRSGLKNAEVAYVADDLPDLPILERAGFAVAVANAAPEVKRAAHYVTRTRGGEGALREVVEVILKAQGKWQRVLGKARA